MAERVTPRRRGSYGIDAPIAPALLAGLVIFYVVLAIVTGKVRFWLLAAFALAMEAYYLYSTLRGKFVVWAGQEAEEALAAAMIETMGEA